MNAGINEDNVEKTFHLGKSGEKSEPSQILPQLNNRTEVDFAARANINETY